MLLSFLEGLFVGNRYRVSKSMAVTEAPTWGPSMQLLLFPPFSFSAVYERLLNSPKDPQLKEISLMRYVYFWLAGVGAHPKWKH